MQTDSLRFALNGDFSLNHTNNDGKQVTQLDMALTTQLKSKDLRKLYFLIGNYRLIDSGAENLQNAWFLHGRFNYKFRKLQWLRFESFIQGQYNQLLVVEQRNLIGAGLRVKWMDRKRFTGYAGNSYMYEVEYSDRAGTTDYNHRNSTYLTVSYAPKSGKFSVANTVYYQPLYKDLSDYRILEQFRLDVPLAEWFKVFTAYNYYLDRETPLNTREYTSNLNIGIGISL
ncbi:MULTISPECIES: DUF481 domain-containing protein [unclassified Leeuwenhoekiella]|uniref:DUF481 domain-containing protein n=1 Tax=unclassified Leeuwenhoekiella TaxID=2615029 RepID=UPI0025C0C6FC|nr:MULTISPECIES: DUF481 domain-containing protein [unclassified Leeuwenhoekiella]|tara:strand:+ start:364 stop:1047 length:684 start_codon:yes stop_codon:yes gene_type:complete